MSASFSAKVFFRYVWVRSSAIVLSVVLGFALASCGGMDPLPPLSPPKSTHKDPAPTNPDQPQKPPSAPVIDAAAIPSTTSGTQIAVSGTAEPGVTILVRGGSAAGGVVEQAGDNGRFCVVVPLSAGAVNSFQVTAFDAVRGESEAASFSVTQLGAGDTDDLAAPELVPVNVAPQATITSTAKPIDHTVVGSVSDGRSDTFAKWSEGDAVWNRNSADAWNGWVIFQLPEPALLRTVEIFWRDGDGAKDGGEYGSEYEIWASRDFDPGTPNKDNGRWSLVRRIKDGDGGYDLPELPYEAKSQAITALAIQLRKDGRGAWEQKTDTSERFALAEVKINVLPPGTMPVSAAPEQMCPRGSSF